MEDDNFRQQATIGSSSVTPTIINKPFHTYENASYDDEMLDIDSNSASNQANFSNITASTTSSTTINSSTRPTTLSMPRNTITESPFPDPNNGE